MRAHRGWLALGVALLLAFAAAAWTGRVTQQAREPDDVRATLPTTMQQPVEVDGARFTVLSLTSGPQFPNVYGDDPVVAVPGASWLLVTYRVEFLDDRSITRYCGEDVVLDPGGGGEAVWDPDTTQAFQLFKDNPVSCRPDQQNPRAPVTRQVAFQVPADVVDSVLFRVGFTDGPWIQVNR